LRSFIGQLYVGLGHYTVLGTQQEAGPEYDLSPCHEKE